MTLRIGKKDNLKYALGAGYEPIATVQADDIFDVECEINCNGGVITSLDKRLKADDIHLPFVNPATGPIHIKGAVPGQMLRLEIKDIIPEGLGYTALWPGIGIFPDWVRKKEFGIHTKVVEVKDGVVHWSDRLKLPVRPMIGVVGVAPVHGSVLTIDNGQHGGNLDVQEITVGNQVMFPIWHEGAHLFMGDCHAIQGDGEVQSVGGIEIATTVRVGVSLAAKPTRMSWPRIETPTHICTVACARPLDDALRLAFEEMIYWLEDGFGFATTEAYMLLGQVAEARCTQMVNPKYTYICKVDKRYLLPEKARDL